MPDDWPPGNPAELPGHRAPGEEWYAATQTDEPISRGQPRQRLDWIDWTIRIVVYGMGGALALVVIGVVAFVVWASLR